MTGALRDDYDALLLDLDGTVFRGGAALRGAHAALGHGSQRRCFVTNNAGRAPAAVAEHLRSLGFEASGDEVLTSAQSAARLAAEMVPAGSRVLVVGTDSFAELIREAGLVPTRTAEDRPAAVVHGYSPENGWRILSEAALAIAAGAVYIATNADTSFPSERGLLIGNGALAAAVTVTTGVTPIFAGKPEAPILDDAVRMTGATRPLLIGDRLDTDIEGAVAAGMDGLLVLTGVASPFDLLRAPARQRPTHVGADLGVLDRPATESRIPEPVAEADGWSVTPGSEGTLVLRAVDGAAFAATPGDGIDADAERRHLAALRLAAAHAWRLPFAPEIVAADAAAAATVAWWGDGWRGIGVPVR